MSRQNFIISGGGSTRPEDRAVDGRYPLFKAKPDFVFTEDIVVNLTSPSTPGIHTINLLTKSHDYGFVPFVLGLVRTGNDPDGSWSMFPYSVGISEIKAVAYSDTIKVDLVAPDNVSFDFTLQVRVHAFAHDGV